MIKQAKNPAVFLTNFAVCKIAISLNIDIAICHQTRTGARHTNLLSTKQRVPDRVKIRASEKSYASFTYA